MVDGLAPQPMHDLAMIIENTRLRGGETNKSLPPRNSFCFPFSRFRIVPIYPGWDKVTTSTRLSRCLPRGRPRVMAMTFDLITMNLYGYLTYRSAYNRGAKLTRPH